MSASANIFDIYIELGQSNWARLEGRLYQPLQIFSVSTCNLITFESKDFSGIISCHLLMSLFPEHILLTIVQGYSIDQHLGAHTHSRCTRLDDEHQSSHSTHSSRIMLLELVIRILRVLILRFQFFGAFYLRIILSDEGRIRSLRLGYLRYHFVISY